MVTRLSIEGSIGSHWSRAHWFRPYRPAPFCFGLNAEASRTPRGRVKAGVCHPDPEVAQFAKLAARAGARRKAERGRPLSALSGAQATTDRETRPDAEAGPVVRAIASVPKRSPDAGDRHDRGVAEGVVTSGTVQITRAVVLWRSSERLSPLICFHVAEQLH